MAQLIQLVDDVGVHSFVLLNEITLIGRRAESDVVIDDSAVSGAHARISRQENPDFPQFFEYYIEDLNSTNGTKVNGHVVTNQHKLADGDIIAIAWNNFKFSDGGGSDLAATRHILS